MLKFSILCNIFMRNPHIIVKYFNISDPHCSRNVSPGVCSVDLTIVIEYSRSYNIRFSIISNRINMIFHLQAAFLSCCNFIDFQFLIITGALPLLIPKRLFYTLMFPYYPGYAYIEIVSRFYSLLP